MLLTRRPQAVLLRPTHWKCPPSDIVHRIAANACPAYGPVSAIVQTALKPLPRPGVQYVAPSSGREQAREEDILQILRSCLHYSPCGWCDPSALHGYPHVSKPWQELGRLLRVSTLRIFLESHKEFEVVPKDSGYGFYFKNRAASSPTPTLVTGLGLASARDIGGGEQAAGSQPGQWATEKLAFNLAPALAPSASTDFYKYAGKQHHPTTEEPGSYSSASETSGSRNWELPSRDGGSNKLELASCDGGSSKWDLVSCDDGSKNWQAELSDDRDLAGHHALRMTSNAALSSHHVAIVAAEPWPAFASAQAFKETGVRQIERKIESKIWLTGLGSCWC
jgi:hypothetical protein